MLKEHKKSKINSRVRYIGDRFRNIFYIPTNDIIPLNHKNEIK